MGFDFLFSAALWALPLAAIPLIVHLLHRRRSPVVLFSTLRFIQASMQRTAARRRIHRWLLLACRMLLLALLIWSVAQPVARLGGGFSGGADTAAAIVVDDTYSMLLQRQGVTRLDDADAAVRGLLGHELASAQVALWKLRDDAAGPAIFRPAPAALADWAGLQPQADQRPLLERVEQAARQLAQQPQPRKWLIVISDLQPADFPRAVAPADDMRPVLVDLASPASRNAGVRRIDLDLASLIAGVPADIHVDLTGPPGDSRGVDLKVLTLQGQPLLELPPRVAAFDAAGRARVTFSIALPNQRHMLVEAALSLDDDMPWDNQRRRIIELPARQGVLIWDGGDDPASLRAIRLALDPSEGRSESWPLTLTDNPQRADALVALWTRWPTQAQAEAWFQFVRVGRPMVIFLRPGLEADFARLAQPHQQALLRLLPSAPLPPLPSGQYRVLPARTDDPLLRGLTGSPGAAAAADDPTRFAAALVRRLAALHPGDADTILSAAAPGQAPRPLLLRRAVGQGLVYCFATLPDMRFYSNLATHPTFLPMLVRMNLRPIAQSAVADIELGDDLTLPGNPVAANVTELRLTGPSGQVRIIRRDEQGAFNAGPADEIGLYTWHAGPDAAPAALSHVQPPGRETELAARDRPGAVPSERSIVATSLADLRAQIDAVAQPDPRWLTTLALVLALLVVEALLGSLTRLWQAPARPAPAALPAAATA